MGGIYGFRFGISSHQLGLIATDGRFIQYNEVDYIDIHVGERFDFILRTDQMPNNYAIRIEMFSTPTITGKVTSSLSPGWISSYANLHYARAPKISSTNELVQLFTLGTIANCISGSTNATCQSRASLLAINQRANNYTPPSWCAVPPPPATREIFLDISVSGGPNINLFRYEPPSTPWVFSEELPKPCNEFLPLPEGCTEGSNCYCNHYLTIAESGYEVIDLIFINPDPNPAIFHPL